MSLYNNNSRVHFYPKWQGSLRVPWGSQSPAKSSSIRRYLLMCRDLVFVTSNTLLLIKVESDVLS